MVPSRAVRSSKVRPNCWLRAISEKQPMAAFHSVIRKLRYPKNVSSLVNG